MPDVHSDDHVEQMKTLYSEMKEKNLYPLWEVLHAIVLPEPSSRAIATRWSYDDARRFLMRAGDLISAEQAERRVLVLENPRLPGETAITPRLYAGLQLVLPGEVAACHRHSQSALRFIMEGSGAYTAVDGERAFMEPFDLILTPNWRWHDHGNPSSEPVIWLDGLDVPTVRALEAEFSERLGSPVHPDGNVPGTNRALYGRSMRPLRSSPSPQPEQREPLFHYPYREWIEALKGAAASEEPDPYLGHALEFTNPTNGGAVMPTISAHVRMLPAGFETGLRWSTESAVLTIVEGRGQVEIDGETVSLEPRDIIVVPTWKATRWRADTAMVLFCFSDRIVQEKLALYRERLH